MMDVDLISKKLDFFELDKKEKEILLILLDKNRLSAYNLSKLTKINKSSCYDALYRLIKKGFVHSSKINKIQYFELNNFDFIKSSLRKKETILEELQLIKKTCVSETLVNVFENSSHQNEFNEMLFDLAKKKKISFCYIIGNNISKKINVDLKLYSFLEEFQKYKQNIIYKGIWHKNFKNTLLFKKFDKLGEQKITSRINSEVTTIIFDNQITYIIEGKPTIIIIKNESISKEMKNYFEIMWDLL